MEQNDKPAEPAKSTDETGDDEAESHVLPKIEPPYKFKLGSSQKKRSKLVQQAEEPAATQPQPAPSPAAPPAEPTPPLRRVRLKRSGQMHEDLTAPMPDEAAPPRKDDQY